MTNPTPTTPASTLKTDSQGRVLFPAEDRETLMDTFEQSGMTGAAFARLHGIQYTTFAYWRQQRRKRRRVGSADPASPVFAEVRIQDGPPPPAGLLIELPGNARMRLDRADQFPLAAALLGYLGR